MAKTIVNVVVETHNEALEKAEALASNASDFNKLLLSAIELYADVSVINTIAENLLQRHAFRYAMNSFTNILNEKVQKIRNALKYIINKKVAKLPSGEYYKLLQQILDDINEFDNINKYNGTAFDLVGDDIDVVRERVETADKNQDKRKYAILSDVVDLLKHSYNNVLNEGRLAYNLVRDSIIGDSELCKFFIDNGIQIENEKFNVVCDNKANNAYKADKINFNRVLKHLVEVYVNLKTIRIVYNILVYNNIIYDNLEFDADYMLEMTQRIIQTIINYYVW
ncbi:MAG: hypothetical protein QW750_08495 [Zestosphaera sp.]